MYIREVCHGLANDTLSVTEALTQGRNVLHYTTSDTNTVVVLSSGGYGKNYYRKYDINIPAGSEVNYTVYRGYSSLGDSGSFYADSSDGEHMIELSCVTPSAKIGTITTPKDITALYASYYSGADKVYRNAIFDLKVTGWQ